MKRFACSLLCGAAMALAGAARALTLDDLIAQVELFVPDVAVTVIREGADETGTASIAPFKLRFGTGALFLMEDNATPPTTADEARERTSDIVVFAPLNQSIITMFSDPLPDSFALPGGVTLSLDEILAMDTVVFQREGTILDSTGHIPPQNSPVPNVTVNIRGGSTFVRAFFVVSDTNESEVPEPSTLALLAAAVAVLATLSKRGAGH